MTMDTSIERLEFSMFSIQSIAKRTTLPFIIIYHICLFKSSSWPKLAIFWMPMTMFLCRRLSIKKWMCVKSRVLSPGKTHDDID